MVEQKINIALDTYNDLFSDFDISAFQNRSISLDFKEELESHYLDNYDSKLDIIFSIPKKQRNESSEKVIKARLIEFFLSKATFYTKRINTRKSRGINSIVMGFICVGLTLIVNTYYLDFLPLYLSNIIMILGWFGIWTGIEKILDVPVEYVNKIQMYNCFSKANIKFIDEEDIKN